MNIIELPPENPSDIYKSLNINNTQLPFNKNFDKQTDSGKSSQNSQRNKIEEQLQSILEHRKLTTSRNTYYQNSASNHKSPAQKLRLSSDLSDKAQQKLNKMLKDMHSSNKKFKKATSTHYGDKFNSQSHNSASATPNSEMYHNVIKVEKVHKNSE